MKNNERLFEAIIEQRGPIAYPSRQRVRLYSHRNTTGAVEYEVPSRALENVKNKHIVN